MGCSVAESVNRTEVYCVKFVVKNSSDSSFIIECDSQVWVKLVQGHEYRQHQNVIKNGTLRRNLELLFTFVVSFLVYTDCSLISSGDFYKFSYE
jgi:hypothetical protein